MKCRHCGTNFPVNIAISGGPGGQEEPGTFLVVTIALVLATLVLLYLQVRYWPWFTSGLAGFVGLQVFVAWMDCRSARCPECQAPAVPRPWSF